MTDNEFIFYWFLTFFIWNIYYKHRHFLSLRMKNSSEKIKKIVLSNIKHDLTNPINAILGYSELLLDIIDMDLVMLKNDLKSIHDSGNSILNDIKKIFSKEAIENVKIAE